MSKLFAGALVVIAFLGVTSGTSRGQAIGSMGQVYQGYQVFETTLVVDARPLAAEILLDGRPLGSAAGTRRWPSAWSRETTSSKWAPGHYAYRGRFFASTQSTSNWFRSSWCPFAHSDLRSRMGVLDEIVAHKRGEVARRERAGRSPSCGRRAAPCRRRGSSPARSAP
jgi:hypothetical protein